MRIKSRRGLPLKWDGRVYPADAEGYCDIPEDVALRAGFAKRGGDHRSGGEEPDAGGGADESAVVDVDLDELDKDGLVELATRLKLDSPSNLKRWGEERLREEIRTAAESEE